MQVSLNENLPIIFGVITTNTIEQALIRAGLSPKSIEKDKSQLQPDPENNKGIEAAKTALRMLEIIAS